MPGKKKKRFIDKKNAVSFHLVHRSQRDPLQADEDAPQRVLLPTEQESSETRKEEQHKYGINFEDDYDYMQHLKTVDELYDVQPTDVIRIPSQTKAQDKNKLVLPSSVFASEVETNEGLLNKAATQSGPQLDWDPDIVAALDDDFNFDNPENLLEDDFITMATGDEELTFDNDDDQNKIANRTQMFVDQQRELLGEDVKRLTLNYVQKESESGSDFGSDDEDDIDSDEVDVSDLEDEDRLGELYDFKDEETKTRFTDYSMSSSVIRRNQGLSLLDDRFEKLYEQYDDDEIGALDHEEITGFIDPESQLMNDALNQFEKLTKKTTMKDVVEPGNLSDAEGAEENEEDKEELIDVEMEPPKEQWDCESILSTYSNLYNHPKVIPEPNRIKLTKRLNIPANVLPDRGPTQKQVEKMSQLDKVPVYRPKDESTEERKERKKAIKEERKLRREEKKANKLAFKDEKKRQEKETLNVKQALQGMKIQ